MRKSSALGAVLGVVVAGATADCSQKSASSPIGGTGGNVDAGDTDGGSPSTPGVNAWRFPKDFMFGTAIAGFQSDMGCPTLPHSACDDRNSDWFTFSTDPSTLADTSLALSGQDPTVVGPGFWELYDQDIARAETELKNTAFRMSIEWSRIFPSATDALTTQDELRAAANPAALATYHAIFASLKAHHLTPLVTLNHYSLPTWIHDAVACHANFDTCQQKGWADRTRTVREIAKYAGFVAAEFGGEVDLWATLNEPMAVVFPGYLSPGDARSNPPGVSLQAAAAKTAIVAMIEAHARMYDAIKQNDTKAASGTSAASVGVVYNMVPIAPKDPANALDVKAAENFFYFWNTAFLRGFCTGDVDENLDDHVVHRADLEKRMDYLGVNYYNRWTVVGSATPVLPEFSPKTTFDPNGVDTTGIYPRGMYDMIMKGKELCSVPMIITENGTAHADHPEIFEGYITDHLRELIRATRDGADVRGYFYWTLTDNFEWNHGMAPRLGFYGVDPTDAQKKRVARPSAATYAQIAAAGAIPDAFIARHPEPAAP